jgi:hypothetical protein
MCLLPARRSTQFAKAFFTFAVLYGLLVQAKAFFFFILRPSLRVFQEAKNPLNDITFTDIIYVLKQSAAFTALIFAKSQLLEGIKWRCVQNSPGLPDLQEIWKAQV